MDLGDITELIVGGYTLWKWYTEYQDRKEKKRSKDLKPEQQRKSKKRH